MVRLGVYSSGMLSGRAPFRLGEERYAVRLSRYSSCWTSMAEEMAVALYVVVSVMLTMVAPAVCRSDRMVDMAALTGLVSLVDVRLKKPSSTPILMVERLERLEVLVEEERKDV